MTTITFTIPDAKLQRVKDGLLVVFPNTEVDENKNPVYTDNEWLKERIRRFIRDTVERGELKVAQDDLRSTMPDADTTVS